MLYTDHVLATMITYLQNLTDRDTALIYVSDHGESLGEHGESTHGTFAYEPTLHVPLIFRLPGVAGVETRAHGTLCQPQPAPH